MCCHAVIISAAPDLFLFRSDFRHTQTNNNGWTCEHAKLKVRIYSYKPLVCRNVYTIVFLSCTPLLKWVGLFHAIAWANTSSLWPEKGSLEKPPRVGSKCDTGSSANRTITNPPPDMQRTSSELHLNKENPLAIREFLLADAPLHSWSTFSASSRESRQVAG